MSRRQLRVQVIRGITNAPQGVSYNFDNISPPAGFQSSKCHTLHARSREVERHDRRIQHGPVRYSEVNSRRRIERQPRQIDAKSPVENVMVGKIAEVAHAVRA